MGGHAGVDGVRTGVDAGLDVARLGSGLGLGSTPRVEHRIGGLDVIRRVEGVRPLAEFLAVEGASTIAVGIEGIAASLVLLAIEGPIVIAVRVGWIEAPV